MVAILKRVTTYYMNNRWRITYKLGTNGKIRHATVICIYQPSREQAINLLPHGVDEPKPTVISIKAARR